MAHRKRTPKEWQAKFWTRVDRNGPNGCWIWTAGKFPFGYGAFKVPGLNMRPAHRLAYEIINGPIPDGLWVLHKCDNPPCCNPEHMFLGTQRDNVSDMVAKGRAPYGSKSGAHKHPERYPKGDQHYSHLRPQRLARGEKSGTTKFTTAQILDIRQRIGYRNASKLAREYGVAVSTICAIRDRRVWAHI